MAWSDKARQAAAEARRRHGGTRGGIPMPNAQQRLAHGFAQTEIKRYERLQRSGYALSQGERKHLADHRSTIRGHK